MFLYVTSPAALDENSSPVVCPCRLVSMYSQYVFSRSTSCGSSKTYFKPRWLHARHCAVFPFLRARSSFSAWIVAVGRRLICWRTSSLIADWNCARFCHAHSRFIRPAPTMGPEPKCTKVIRNPDLVDIDHNFNFIFTLVLFLFCMEPSLIWFSNNFWDWNVPLLFVSFCRRMTFQRIQWTLG